MDINERVACPTCGSKNLRHFGTAWDWKNFEDGGTEYHSYRCKHCGTAFRTERSYVVTFTSEEQLHKVLS